MTYSSNNSQQADQNPRKMMYFEDQSPQFEGKLMANIFDYDQQEYQLFHSAKGVQASTGASVRKQQTDFREVCKNTSKIEKNEFFDENEEEHFDILEIPNHEQRLQHQQNCTQKKKQNDFEKTIQGDFVKQQKKYNNIFVKKDFKQKNTNFVKFLIPHLIKKAGTKEALQWSQQLHNLSIQLKNNPKMKINTDLLHKILVNSKDEKKHRQVVFQLSKDSQFIKRYIFQNGYIRSKNKKQYLVCLKVFGIRSRSRCLVERIESR